MAIPPDHAVKGIRGLVGADTPDHSPLDLRPFLHEGV